MEAFPSHHVESLWKNCCQRWKQNIPWVQYCTQNTVGDKSVHFSVSWLQFWPHLQVVDTIHCWMNRGVHKCTSSLCTCQHSLPMEPCTYRAYVLQMFYKSLQWPSISCTGPMSIYCQMSLVSYFTSI